MFKQYSLAAVLVAIAAHAGAQDWQGSIAVSESEFKPYVGLQAEIKEEVLNDVRYRSVLFGNVSKAPGDPIIYGLFVRASYVSDRRKEWKAASTDRGEWLDLSNDDRHVESCARTTCIFVNAFSVLLKPEMLQRAAAEPMRIQFRGPGVEYTYAISTTEAQMLLKAAQETADRFK